MNAGMRAFVERISSLATHEIMNGLATIGESAGLLSDLVALGVIGATSDEPAPRPRQGLFGRLLGRRAAPAQDKATASLDRSLTRCATGVDRVGEVALALNRFLHGLTAHEDPVPGVAAVRVAATLLCPTARKYRRAIVVAEPFPDFGLAGFPLLALYRPLIESAEAALHVAHAPSADAAAPETVYLHGAVRGNRAAVVISDRPRPPTPDALFAADPGPGTTDISPRIRLPHGEAVFSPAV